MKHVDHGTIFGVEGVEGKSTWRLRVCKIDNIPVIVCDFIPYFMLLKDTKRNTA